MTYFAAPGRTYDKLCVLHQEILYMIKVTNELKALNVAESPNFTLILNAVLKVYLVFQEQSSDKGWLLTGFMKSKI
jgi:hypothetical protein